MTAHLAKAVQVGRQTEFLSVGVAVRVEDLKASLQAYIEAADAMIIVQECISAWKKPVKLSAELVREIELLVFKDIEHRYRAVMRELYRCTYDYTKRCGPSLLQLGLRVDANVRTNFKSEVKDFSKTSCDTCAQLRDFANSMAGYRETEGDMAFKSTEASQAYYAIRCEYCRDWLSQAAQTDTISFARGLKDWEWADISLDRGAALRKHPQGCDIANSSRLCMGLRYGFLQGWHRHVHNDTLFTARERELLSQYNFYCWTDRGDPSPVVFAHTEAWLILHELPFGCDRSRLQPRATGNEGITKEQRLLTEEILQDLALVPEPDIWRSSPAGRTPFDPDPQPSRIEWPQSLLFRVIPP